MKTLVFFLLILITVGAQAQVNKDLRIAVVGGGPAGLSAALRLQKSGFSHVTVLEQAPEVGGKTETITYQGRTYEMGAIMSGPSYTEVIELAKEMGEKIVPFSEGGAPVVVADPLRAELQPMPIAKKLRFLAAAVEYHVLYSRFRNYFEKPGMSRIPPELNEPFATWIVKNAHFHAELQELLSHSFVSFGYGYMSEIPAAYVMRYFSPRLLRSFMFGQVNMLKDGYQNLWKKVASKLNVETGFKVQSAHFENGRWSVTSASGKQSEFDTVIWTAPLDAAAGAIDLPESLKGLFSKIDYQYYNSSLVEVEGLAHGSGVVTKNYDAQAEGHVVSWLYRWPKETNVANFYTLSDRFMPPEQVEAGLNAFAQTHGFKISKTVKSVGWKYFPHFQQTELDEMAYATIESEQGRNGLYFAGELMNFSTVEHTTEYSRALVEKFFTNQGKLSEDLPANYLKLGAKEKLDVLWRKVLKTEYPTEPKYSDLKGSVLKELGGFLPSQLAKAFNNNTDIIEAGREKVIHKLGSTALLSFEPANRDYKPFDALIRLSNAVDGSTGKMYPSFSIKIPLDGDDRSINFIVGKSFDGQHIGDDFGGPPDFNFFRDDVKYPFSNELPLEPKTAFGKAFKWVFDRAHLAPNYIPVSEMSKVMNKPAPRRFIFRAPENIRSLMPSNVYTDERAVMGKIPVGSVLFDVYESNGLGDPGRFVGRLRTTTRFVNSRFGDENLYFRHEARDVKNRLPEFSQGAARTPPRPASSLPRSCPSMFSQG